MPDFFDRRIQPDLRSGRSRGGDIIEPNDWPVGAVDPAVHGRFAHQSVRGHGIFGALAVRAIDLSRARRREIAHQRARGVGAGGLSVCGCHGDSGLVDPVSQSPCQFGRRREFDDGGGAEIFRVAGGSDCCFRDLAPWCARASDLDFFGRGVVF